MSVLYPKSFHFSLPFSIIIIDDIRIRSGSKRKARQNFYWGKYLNILWRFWPSLNISRRHVYPFHISNMLMVISWWIVPSLYTCRLTDFFPTKSIVVQYKSRQKLIFKWFHIIRRMSVYRRKIGINIKGCFSHLLFMSDWSVYYDKCFTSVISYSFFRYQGGKLFTGLIFFSIDTRGLLCLYLFTPTLLFFLINTHVCLLVQKKRQ